MLVTIEGMRPGHMSDFARKALRERRGSAPRITGVEQRAVPEPVPRSAGTRAW